MPPSIVEQWAPVMVGELLVCLAKVFLANQAKAVASIQVGGMPKSPVEAIG